jgi:uncharacterized protein YfaQ (DUF2300 family)
VAHSSDELDKLTPLAQAWEQQARAAYLTGYQARGAAHAAGGRDRVRQRACSACSSSRRRSMNCATSSATPDWVSVPLQGIKALLGTGRSN